MGAKHGPPYAVAGGVSGDKALEMPPGMILPASGWAPSQGTGRAVVCIGGRTVKGYATQESPR
jgi:hypothetical protein